MKFDKADILTDEELAQVAGGYTGQTADDSRFLNSLNGSTDRYGYWRIAFSFGFLQAEIRKGWETVGVRAELNKNSPNRYYIGEREVTQEEARQHAMEQTQHFMTEKDWKW